MCLWLSQIIKLAPPWQKKKKLLLAIALHYLSLTLFSFFISTVDILNRSSGTRSDLVAGEWEKLVWEDVEVTSSRSTHVCSASRYVCICVCVCVRVCAFCKNRETFWVSSDYESSFGYNISLTFSYSHFQFLFSHSRYDRWKFIARKMKYYRFGTDLCDMIERFIVFFRISDLRRF